MKRTLSIKRETLAELSPAELVQVAGADAMTGNGPTCPLLDCYVTQRGSCYCCTATASC
jgi:hypothetical protein